MTGFHQLAVIRLSQLKLTDTGMKLLLRQPILSLKDIDLSFTGVTVSSLKQLCQGKERSKPLLLIAIIIGYNRCS